LNLDVNIKMKFILFRLQTHFLLLTLLRASPFQSTKCFFSSWVYFYEDFYLSGQLPNKDNHLSMEPGICYNLEVIGMSSRVGSVDINSHCILLIDEINCALTGTHLRLTRDGLCHLNLSNCDFAYKAKSVILCD